jgi:hypothetical protein
MNGKKKRYVILIVLAVVVLAAGILGGRELWLYEHPEMQITFSYDKRENLYRSYPFCAIRGRSHIGQGYAARYDEEIQRCGKRTDIPGAYTFSTLERGKANEEKSIMDNRGMYHTNQYMGYQGNLFVQQSRSNHHI